MRILFISFYTMALVVLVHCSSKQQKKTEATIEGSPEAVFRHLAWAEGDLQTDYVPDRVIAQNKLDAFEKNPDQNASIEEQLEYLSVLSAAGKTQEAETKMKAFLVKNPGEKRGLFLLAVHFMRNKKKELALHFFNQLEKEKSFAWKSLIYNNLGMLALQDKDRRSAIEYFEKAIKSEPPTAAPLVNLGALYLQSRTYKESYPLFEKAVALDDEMEDAWVGLGASLEGQGRFEEAHAVYTRYREKNPNALSVLYNDAIILGNRLKNRTEAGELMLRYIQRGGKETARAHEVIQSWR